LKPNEDTFEYQQADLVQRTSMCKDQHISISRKVDLPCHGFMHCLHKLGLAGLSSFHDQQR
jgi:hypothetical protein